MKKETFGQFLRSLRLRKGFGLRKFAKRIQMLPSNLSHVENGRANPPRDEQILLRIARALDLVEDSEEWNKLFDLAAAAGQLASDVTKYLRQQDALQELPIMARAIKSQKLTKEQIRKLIDNLRNL